ncbi:MAG: amidase [Alphaproteobacteria bacterium]
MSLGPELPSVAQLLEIAGDFGIDMTPDRAAEYRDTMAGGIRAMRRIDDLPEDQPEVKYPRTTGRRPKPEENPYNAWYWVTDIKGAADGPLKGERIGIKDVVSVAGVPMMNGSRVLEGYVPQIDATVVTRLLDAGAVIVGKTASSDFSFSSGGHTSAFGPVRNPHKPSHSPGGSSKGSGAAIAAGDVKMALGGDQGGSIRIPAAWCGVVGLKQTHGLVPYTGCMGIEMSFDTVGPMADSVENVARMLSVLAGPDPLDPRQRGVIPDDYVEDYLPAIGQGCEGLTIGVVEEGFGHKADTWPDLQFLPSDRRVDAKVRATVKGMKQMGAKVRKVSVPMHYDGMRIWFALAAEGAVDVMHHRAGGSNWQGYYDTPLLDHVAKSLKARPNDIPMTVINVLLMGEYLRRHYHGRYYAKAQNQRGSLAASYDAALAECDVLVMPTIPQLSGPIPPPNAPFSEYMFRALNMLNNCPQMNATGHPAISVPCGMIDGLPVGLQIIGRHFDDFTVLRAADASEKLGDWRKR